MTGTVAGNAVRQTDELAAGPAGDPEAVDPVREEVLAAFLRYERALVAGDSATMTDCFLDSPQTLRFGIADQQVGARALAEWRTRQPPAPAGRRLFDTRVVVLNRDAAVVTTLFDYPGNDPGGEPDPHAEPDLGRQSQTWVRTGEGWRVVHAHVSQISRQ